MSSIYPSSHSETEALLALAQREIAAGQLDGAQEKCLRVLSTHKHHPAALELLGTILNSRGRYEDAVRVFNALTLLQPRIARHWENLGSVLRPTARREQARAAFERALQLAPPTPELLYNLGVLQMDRCDHRAAYLALRDGMALAPADGRLRWAFAQCCFDVARREEALEALEGWQHFEMPTIEFSVLIIQLLGMLAAVDPAEPAVERLLANPPRSGRAALGCITILERLHRLDEAGAALEQLELHDPRLEPDPDRLMMSAVLASRGGRHEEAYRGLMRALSYQKDAAHRHRLQFPLARTCDALGRYEEAFAVAEEAHRSQVEFVELAQGKASIEQSQYWMLTASGCDSRDVATWGAEGPTAEKSPIFIVGFPRSGTTLLEQVLDSHPLLQSMDEQGLVLRAVTEITNRGINYPSELGILSDSTLDEVRAAYWERARKRVRLLPGRRLVDKVPLNLIFVPMIRRLFPNAPIIVAIRHPCDTLLSCFLQHFASPPLALACRDLTTLARVYSRSFGFWYAQTPLLRPRSYELRYESLTADFDSEVHKLSTFLGLPWDDAMLAPGAHARAKGFISTPSYAQVIEPISSRSVNRWRHYERHFIEALPILMPWMERWGYAVE